MVSGTSYLLVKRQARQVIHVQFLRKLMGDWGAGWRFCAGEFRRLFSQGRAYDMGREVDELPEANDKQYDTPEPAVSLGGRTLCWRRGCSER